MIMRCSAGWCWVTCLSNSVFELTLLPFVDLVVWGDVWAHRVEWWFTILHHPAPLWRYMTYFMLIVYHKEPYTTITAICCLKQCILPIIWSLSPNIVTLGFWQVFDNGQNIFELCRHVIIILGIMLNVQVKYESMNHDGVCVRPWLSVSHSLDLSLCVFVTLFVWVGLCEDWV